MHADRIHVLERGRIVEVGGHDELRRAQGTLLRDVAPAGRRTADHVGRWTKGGAKAASLFVVVAGQLGSDSNSASNWSLTPIDREHTLLAVQHHATNVPQMTERLSQTVDIETPELVVVSYTVAGLGSRVYAALIDLAICALAFVVVIVGVLALGSRPPPSR